MDPKHIRQPDCVQLLKALSSDSLRLIAARTAIGKNRLHSLRRDPRTATLLDLLRLSRAGYISLKILTPTC